MRSYGELVRHQGNEWLYTAVELSVLAIARGLPLHIHAEGLRGTGKTTVMRAARGILPPIERIAGCPCNCLPEKPHCPEHAGRDPEDLVRLGREWVPMPFYEVSPSAKLGTVVGSIDLGRALDRERPEAALLPGTLARSHRGIVFIDEINRLADISPELADALLDVMGTKPGRLQIEETGLPTITLGVSVSVWAASNPDEEPGPLSDIRRQLSDRFDLTIPMSRPERLEEVEAVLRRDPFQEAIDGMADGPAISPRAGWEAALKHGLPEVPESVRALLARVYLDFKLESLRAVESWQAAARLRALVDGRPAVRSEDLLVTAPLALTHRVELGVLGEIIAFLRGGRETRPAEVSSRFTPANRGGADGYRPAATLPPVGNRGKPVPAFSPRAGHPSPPAAGDGRSLAASRSSWWDRWRGTASRAPALADPQPVQEFAPPHAARPLTRLAEGELVRTPRPEPGASRGFKA